jgi:hypothetical protein
MDKSRLKKLLEQIAAAKPVHDEKEPVEHTPEVKEEKVHAGEQKAEEVEAPIIESFTTEELNEAFAAAGLDTTKYTTEYLAEQLGFKKVLLENASKEKFDSWVKRYPKDQPGVAAEIASNDARAEVNNELLRDVRGTIAGRGGKDAKNIAATSSITNRNESYTISELHEAFTAAGLDTSKYTTEYLAEQLGFEPLNEKPEVVIPAVSGQKEVPQAYIYDDHPKGKEYGRATQDNPVVNDMQGEGSGTRLYVTHDQAAELAKDRDRFIDGRKIKLGKGEKPQLPGLVKESYTLSELNEAFAAAGLDTNKFTTEYLAERLGFRQLNELLPWHDTDNAFLVTAPDNVEHSTVKYEDGKDGKMIVATTKDGKKVRWLDPKYSTADFKKAKEKKEPVVRESFASWSKSKALNEFNPYLQRKMSIDGVSGETLATMDPDSQAAQIEYSLNKAGIDVGSLSPSQLAQVAALSRKGYMDPENLEFGTKHDGVVKNLFLKRKGINPANILGPKHGPVGIFHNMSGKTGGGISVLRKMIVNPSASHGAPGKPAGPKPDSPKSPEKKKTGWDEI